jgi:hypothetical protein
MLCEGCLLLLLLLLLAARRVLPHPIGLRLRAGIRPPAALARIYSWLQAKTGVWWAGAAVVGQSVRACVRLRRKVGAINCT